MRFFKKKLRDTYCLQATGFERTIIIFLYPMSILFPTAASCSGKVEFGGQEEEAVVAGGGGGGGGTVGGGGPAEAPPSPQSDGGGGGSDTDAGDIQGDNVVLEDEVVKY